MVSNLNYKEHLFKKGHLYHILNYMYKIKTEPIA